MSIQPVNKAVCGPGGGGGGGKGSVNAYLMKNSKRQTETDRQRQTETDRQRQTETDRRTKTVFVFY